MVTGASRGIGRHLAAALEEAGYAVERGSRQVAEVTDRRRSRWVADIVDRHGRIDLLVNNAGVIDTEVALADSDPDEWWHTVEVNLRGPYLMTRAVLPEMLAAGSGRVVNLTPGPRTAMATGRRPTTSARVPWPGSRRPPASRRPRRSVPSTSPRGSSALT